MLERLQTAARAAVEKVAALHIKGAPRLMVYLFIIIIFAAIGAFLAGWCFNWWSAGKADLPVMIQFLGAVSSVSFVAAVAFFGRALIDENDDGIPDEFEKEDEDEKNPRRGR